jgi:hypothetical protein
MCLSQTVDVTKLCRLKIFVQGVKKCNFDFPAVLWVSPFCGALLIECVKKVAILEFCSSSAILDSVSLANVIRYRSKGRDGVM